MSDRLRVALADGLFQRGAGRLVRDLAGRGVEQSLRVSDRLVDDGRWTAFAACFGLFVGVAYHAVSRLMRSAVLPIRSAVSPVHAVIVGALAFSSVASVSRVFASFTWALSVFAVVFASPSTSFSHSVLSAFASFNDVEQAVWAAASCCAAGSCATPRRPRQARRSQWWRLPWSCCPSPWCVSSPLLSLAYHGVNAMHPNACCCNPLRCL